MFKTWFLTEYFLHPHIIPIYTRRRGIHFVYKKFSYLAARTDMGFFLTFPSEITMLYIVIISTKFQLHKMNLKVSIHLNSNSHCRYCDWLQRQNQVLPNGTKINWKSLVISDFVIPDLQNGQNAPKMPTKCLYDFCFLKTCKT